MCVVLNNGNFCESTRVSCDNQSNQERKTNKERPNNVILQVFTLRDFHATLQNKI